MKTEAKMKLDLPDDILFSAEASSQELRLALALQLYSDSRVNYADACKLAEVAPGLFDRELARRDISVIRFPSVNTWRERQRAG
ncbi:MAG: hypothetical protein DRP83_04440 [Planctomycetota bacterium]|nr:MAG: hypothetical protein DRP83_04440 [Planctomycetota bacterium]